MDVPAIPCIRAFFAFCSFIEKTNGAGERVFFLRGDEPLMRRQSGFCARRTLSAHLSLAARQCSCDRIVAV